MTKKQKLNRAFVEASEFIRAFKRLTPKTIVPLDAKDSKHTPATLLDNETIGEKTSKEVVSDEKAKDKKSKDEKSDILTKPQFNPLPVLSEAIVQSNSQSSFLKLPTSLLINYVGVFFRSPIS